MNWRTFHAPPKGRQNSCWPRAPSYFATPLVVRWDLIIVIRGIWVLSNTGTWDKISSEVGTYLIKINFHLLWTWKHVIKFIGSSGTSFSHPSIEGGGAPEVLFQRTTAINYLKLPDAGQIHLQYPGHRREFLQIQAHQLFYQNYRTPVKKSLYPGHRLTRAPPPSIPHLAMRLWKVAYFFEIH